MFDLFAEDAGSRKLQIYLKTQKSSVIFPPLKTILTKERTMLICYQIIYLLCVSILKNNGIIGMVINLINLRILQGLRVAERWP